VAGAMYVKYRSPWWVPWRLFFIIGVCSSLVACEMGMKVDISGDPSNPILTLANGQVIGGRTPCLTDITLSRLSANEPETPIWRAESANGCLSVRSIRYLGPNPGLIVKKGPEPLEPEMTYEVSVHGWGWIGGCDFAYRAGRFQINKDRCS